MHTKNIILEHKDCNIRIKDNYQMSLTAQNQACRISTEISITIIVNAINVAGVFLVTAAVDCDYKCCMKSDLRCSSVSSVLISTFSKLKF